MNYLKVFHYTEVENEPAEQGAVDTYVRWLITEETGAPNFSMRLFELKPNGYSPHHEHPWEHEVFVLEGEAHVVGGGEEKKIGPGDVIFIPANEKHQFKNIGNKPLKFICLVPIRP